MRFRLALAARREDEPDGRDEAQGGPEQERRPELDVDGAELIGAVSVVVVTMCLAVVVRSVRLVLDVARVMQLRRIVGGIVGHRGAAPPARILARRLGGA